MPASRLPQDRQDLIIEEYQRTGSVTAVHRATGHAEETIRRVLRERELDPESVAKSLDLTIEAAQAKDLERVHQQELRKALAAEQRLRRYEQILQESLQAYDPTPLVIDPPVRGSKPEHPWVLAVSDWHIGQKTRMEETGGIYYQDIATTRKQVAKMWTALRDIYEVESQSRFIPELHILNLGDLVDGDDMRPSQHRKVEEVFTVQTVQAFDLLAWLIRQSLSIFPKVYIDGVGGNHDRLSRKPGDAGLGELDYIDTMAWLQMAFVERVFEEDIKAGRLCVRNWQTFFGYKEVAGNKLVFEHGSSFKWSTQSYGGVPWYGVQTLGSKYQSMLGAADLVFLGHGHRASILPNGRGWILSNGALPATSTYVQANMKQVSRPVQWLIALHAEHGLTGFHPIYAESDNVLLPGAIWEDPEHYADLASGSKHLELPS